MVITLLMNVIIMFHVLHAEQHVIHLSLKYHLILAIKLCQRRSTHYTPCC